ncbi:MAG: biotin--[acetyl-CoA-carboxylase] ligase, partial [Sandaracinobacteroides sp.]
MILHLEEVGSTSDWLRANAGQFADGQWVRADRQTAGRGRLGRTWQSLEGNLAMSGLIRLPPGEGPAAELG